MRYFLAILLTAGLLSAGEVPLREFVKTALENSLELKSSQNRVKSSEYEYRAARAMLFPVFRIEESFVQTDIPGQVMFIKLNQKRFTFADITNPDTTTLYETKFTIEIPIWMGGKLRAFKKMAKYRWEGDRENHGRKEEEVILKVYEAYANAVLAKNAVEVSETAVKDAEEHVRIAQRAYKVGLVLFADVLRAKVYLSKAKEKLQEAKNNYEVAKRALELLVNKEYGDFDVKDFQGCPSVSPQKLREVALREREDLRAVDRYLKSLEEGVRAARADLLPKVYAFANYSTYDWQKPFGSEADGYMVGVGVKWEFNLGFAPLFKTKSMKERVNALRNQRELLTKAILFEIEKSLAEYENAFYSLRSAEARMREAKEVVRVVRKRYEEGLARMVDLLDAQTQLDMARFEYIKALRDCNVAYAKALYSAGILKEEVLK
ncbi:MAG: TolC family protein [Aquificae bacterium]|nr:TolC family protein [Aquificota bacterium]